MPGSSIDRDAGAVRFGTSTALCVMAQAHTVSHSAAIMVGQLSSAAHSRAQNLIGICCGHGVWVASPWDCIGEVGLTSGSKSGGFTVLTPLPSLPSMNSRLHAVLPGGLCGPTILHSSVARQNIVCFQALQGSCKADYINCPLCSFQVLCAQHPQPA